MSRKVRPLERRRERLHEFRFKALKTILNSRLICAQCEHIFTQDINLLYHLR